MSFESFTVSDQEEESHHELHHSLLSSYTTTSSNGDGEEILPASHINKTTTAQNRKNASQIIKIFQYLCVLISGCGSLYFLSTHLYFIALEYFQVWFISSLIVFLDMNYPQPHHPAFKIISFLFTIFVAIGWGSTYFFTSTRLPTLHGSEFYIASFLAALTTFLFMGGMLAMASVISSFEVTNSVTDTVDDHTLIKPKTKRKVAIIKCVELDLLLYMISLNVICFFSENSFNNNLHMILDIRTIVMLFTGIYQEREKMNLLQIPSFGIIIFLMVISFVLYSTTDNALIMIGDCLYIIIGSLLFYEAKKGNERSKAT